MIGALALVNLLVSLVNINNNNICIVLPLSKSKSNYYLRNKNIYNL